MRLKTGVQLIHPREKPAILVALVLHLVLSSVIYKGPGPYLPMTPKADHWPCILRLHSAVNFSWFQVVFRTLMVTKYGLRRIPTGS